MFKRTSAISSGYLCKQELEGQTAEISGARASVREVLYNKKTLLTIEQHRNTGCQWAKNSYFVETSNCSTFVCSLVLFLLH